MGKFIFNKTSVQFIGNKEKAGFMKTFVLFIYALVVCIIIWIVGLCDKCHIIDNKNGKKLLYTQKCTYTEKI